MNNEIEVSVAKVKRRKKILKITRLILLFLLLFVVISYVVMNFIYNNGNFSITLDKNLYFERGIIIYDDPDYKVFRTELFAKPVEYFDNISNKWLPNDIDGDKFGSHNGENYLAYTFFVENTGTDTSDYWSEIIIDDVIKNVDEAVRIRVYKNGNFITYAKLGIDGKAEKDTIPFVSDEIIAFEHRIDFKPGDIDKYTIVIWIEGHDLQCTDNILGGEIKMHMEFNSEFVDIDPEKYEKELD